MAHVQSTKWFRYGGHTFDRRKKFVVIFLYFRVQTELQFKPVDSGFTLIAS